MSETKCKNLIAFWKKQSVTDTERENLRLSQTEYRSDLFYNFDVLILVFE